jgi:hypothetical protein
VAGEVGRVLAVARPPETRRKVRTTGGVEAV